MQPPTDWEALVARFAEPHRELVVRFALEAPKHFSPAGCEYYRRGVEALLNLGRGEHLALAYLEAAPAIAREVGEDAAEAARREAAKLASMTSGEVIARFLATLPLVARRLGDADLFTNYLTFIHQLASLAPRALRPLFAHLEPLLDTLTLGGLRRWALFGAELHRQDTAALTAYFSLESAEAKAKLQEERRGTLFVDTHRKLNAFLRALWGRDFWLKPNQADRNEFRPYIDDFVLHLPDAVDRIGALDGIAVYRAIAAHMAAHLVYGGGAHDPRGLGSLERALYGFLEDLRVEYAAAQAFPGLGHAWAKLARHSAPPPNRHPAAQWLLTLIDRCYHRWGWRTDPVDAPLPKPLAACVDRIVAAFATPVDAGRKHLRMLLEHLRTALEATDAGTPMARDLEALPLCYRDDNRIIWHFDAESLTRKLHAMRRQPLRRIVPLMEFINEVDTETQSDTPDEIWVPATPIYDDDGITFQEKYGSPRIAGPFFYDEWDERAQCYRPDWVSCFEYPAPLGELEPLDALYREHLPVVKRLRKIVERLRPQGVQRERKLEDGDELDLTPAIDAMIHARAGLPFDPRITLRHKLLKRDIAVCLLLDLSASTNDTPHGAHHSVLDATRAATLLLAEAIERIGDPLAILGFHSDGREDVRLYPIKRFGERWGENAKKRLAGINGAFSTRMGAALRHAGAILKQQPQKRKLLLLVTDGEPADIDERDPNHLRRDARRAVDELWGNGVYTYCLTLDPGADRYVAQIFGKHYTVIDRVDKLPERLPRLFAALTR
jgi:hypothetical protein